MRKTFRAYAQSRGNLRADAFDLSDCSFKDKISGFNVVFVATYIKTASIQGRASFSDAYHPQHTLQAPVSPSPWLSVLATERQCWTGRLTHDMGLYDLGVYHILRATLITTSGKSVMTRPQIFRRVFATTNATPNIANVQFVLIEAYSISEAWETPHFLQSGKPCRSDRNQCSSAP